MSDNRSSSGVRNLRAVFEPNTSTTSPPSRGRSPACSDTSRPRSKVRTSFVAVEPSGQQGLQLGLRKASSNGDSLFGIDGTHDAKTTHIKSPAKPSPVRMAEHVKTNGNGIAETAHSPANGEMPTAAIQPKGPNGALPTELTIQTDETSHANLDKPISGEDDENADLKPADPKDANAVSGGSALSPVTENLGQLLKGSPFQPESQESAAASVPAVSSPTEQSASPKKAKAQATPAKRNGKPREPTPAKSASTATAKATGSRPLTISTSKEATSASTASKPTAAGKSATTPKTPHTPKTLHTSDRKPSSTTHSPKQPTRSPRQPVSSRSSFKEPSKESSREKPGRSPVATKSATVAAPKPRQTSASESANANKKTTPTSPLSKPKPRSPTRPVRLPASATAPTAASAAKVAGGQPSRSPSRASISSNLGRKPSTLNKDRTLASSRGVPPGASSNQGRKTSRPSLPASSNASDKPKTRTSIGAPKAADQGFLARMMRPTASSTSKTHEKLEVKTPPKSQHLPLRPKRKSAVNEEKAKTPEQHVEEAKAPVEEEENVSTVGDVEGTADGSANGLSAAVAAG
ncbi:hypothetical protein LPUS_04817 [Lasallia pustulata]|uniref:Mucin-7 n=1 Tax=Lasallia pustulata TaxID=136370 RepID=A0A1W5CXP7_9LECA|nr:hypothetical protein LPUS_04817 [Lasallia pustulata]